MSPQGSQVTREELHTYIQNFDKDLLAQGARELGLTLTRQELEAFALYYALLVAWNQRLNLTTITEPEEVIRKHFLDSLAPLPILAEEVVRDEEKRGHLVEGAAIDYLRRQPWRAIDVGAGAGLPGLAVKIVWSPLRLTLLDGTLKKVRFMNEAIRTLGLRRAVAIHGRAEEYGRDAAFREQFDLVLARGVAPLNTLAEYTLPFARVGGWTIAYKGPRAPEELSQAFGAIEILGGVVERVAPLHIPGLNEGRFAVLIRKVQRTPKRYPRGQGLPRRRPLR
ncbi:MAG: 16S rRNA (guanine(527)-N(7))-methyltransferase RsmG [Chloroflexi bacterium]|nr:16S rRNA (guanine(527)-N(7))-methyltransferase RsmG [Chloroflexota bacterium]